jgi:hypothetical protein
MPKTKELYSGSYLAHELKTTRETVFRSMKAGKIEAPAYEVVNPGTGRAPTYAWSAAQVERIKRKWEPGKPGRPPMSPQGGLV